MPQPPSQKATMLANKLKSSQGFKSEDGTSLNLVESRNDRSWMHSGADDYRNSDTLATNTTKIIESRPIHSSSAVLNNFLAQQEKRIDFANS